MTGALIKSIMVPVRGDGMGANVLAHAAVVAKKFASRVQVVHCHPRADDLMPFGVVIPAAMRQQIEKAAQANVDVTAKQLSSEFKDIAAKLDLKEQNPGQDDASAVFVEYEGKQIDAVKHFGRLADLICIPQPEPERNLGANTLKTALFSSGRAVMMCPNGGSVPQDFCERVTFAWNGSLEASRAAALAMPLIETAQSVTILTSGESEHSASAEEFQVYLETRGVSSTVRRFAGHGVVGGQLLEETEAVGAGLLIMGAYHQSFERETVLGGNSQTVVSQSKKPVVLVH
ncbi:MAG: universal stress protein [Pseudomonadota bacterium]